MVMTNALKRDHVDVAWLKRLDACPEHVELFGRTFGARVDVTPDAINRAAAAGLDPDWIAERILTAPARAAYEQAKATALAAYEQAKATALFDVIFGDRSEPES